VTKRLGRENRAKSTTVAGCHRRADQAQCAKQLRKSRNNPVRECTCQPKPDEKLKQKQRTESECKVAEPPSVAVTVGQIEEQGMTMVIAQQTIRCERQSITAEYSKQPKHHYAYINSQRRVNAICIGGSTRSKQPGATREA
jgi:hypothetical protein